MSTLFRRVFLGGRPSAETLADWVETQQELTRILASAADLGSAAPAVFEALGTGLRWDLGALYWLDRRTSFLRCGHLWKGRDVEAPRFLEATRAMAFSKGQALPGRAWEAGEPVWAVDVGRREEFTRTAAAAEDGVKSVVAFPILSGEVCYGVLELAALRVRKHDAHQVHLLATFGSALGQFVTRANAVHALRVREQELHDLFENSPIGVHVASPDGKVLRANQAELELLGLERGEYVGHPLRDFHADPAVIDDLFARLARGEEVRNLDSRVRRKDGTVRWVRLNANGHREGDALVRTRAFSRDVTAAKEALAALEKSEERYRSLVEGARGYAIHGLSPDGRVASWNSGARTLYGWGEDEVQGLDFRSLFTAEDREDGVPERMLRLAADEGRFHHEGWSVRKDGSRFWSEVTFTARRGADGEVFEVTQLTRDASDQRRMEALRRKASELESENVAVLRAQRRASEVAAALTLSLEPPVAALERAAALLRASGGAPGTGSAGAVSPAENIVLGVAEIRRILARAEDAVAPAAAMPLEPVEVDLLRLAVESRDLLRAAAAERRIRVDVDVDPELTLVVADAGRLRQVLYNLLSNAIKFSRERGRVALRVLPEGDDSFRIEVEDAGIGIAPADVARIFEGTDESGKGVSGIGLPVTKRIVEQQGGRIAVQSAPGRGSVFSVVLPREARVAAPESATPSPAAPLPSASGVRRLLVVAEDAPARASLAWTFGNAGYEVISAGSSSEALDVARERRCDVVVLDLLAREEPAADFVAALRAEGASRAAESLFLVIQPAEGGPTGFLVADVLPSPMPADRLFAALERSGVPRGGDGPVLVLDGDLQRLKAAGHLLEVLGYRALLEADSDRALTTCAEQIPVAVVMSPFPAGLDAFEFLHHLRRIPRLANVPIVLASPTRFDEAQVEVLRAAAAAAAESGAGRPAAVFGNGDAARDAGREP